MVVKAVRHFGIIVRSIERSLNFYRDLLGLQVVRIMDESGVYLDNILSLKDSRITTVKMAAQEGSALIELLEFKSHHESIRDRSHDYSVGASHVALTVDDLDQVYRLLSDAHVPFNAPPQLSPDGNVMVTYCKDPDGTLIELVQVVKHPNHAGATRT